MPDHNHPEQDFHRTGFRFLWLIALLLPLFALGACGKKPNQLDSPPGTENDRYLKTYPDINTDPKP